MQAAILGTSSRSVRVAAALGGSAARSASVLCGVGAALYALYLLAPGPLAAACHMPVELRASAGVRAPLWWSVNQERPVVGIVAEMLPYEATLVGFALAGVAGFLAAAALLRRRGHGQTVVTAAALGLCAAPTWVVAVIAHGLLLERYHPVSDTSLGGWWSAMVPGLAIGVMYGGVVTHLRGRTDEPLLDIVADKLPALLSALVVEEIVLGRAGFGRMLVASVYGDDTSVVLALVFVFAVFCVAFRFLAGLPRALSV